jgi:16S rRNA (cytosine1402-N4)-methyltransferase
MNYHQPVMLEQCLEGLNIKPDGTYVDVTFGGGGHSRAILDHLSAKGKLIAFDQDNDATENLPDDGRVVFVNHNFRFLKNFLQYYNINRVDGLLADLGVSSHHFDIAERGFSFRQEAALDMRMNRNATLTAAEVVNEYSEEALRNILYQYGELREAGKLARAIIKNRQLKTFETTTQLSEALQMYTPRNGEHKFLAKVFQALRIEVNHEMESLRRLLEQSSEVIAPGGRLVVITYHSLEDRLVKNYIKAGNFDGKITRDLYGNYEAPFAAVYRNIIVPDEKETEENNRARSAKLRVAEKVNAI